MLWRNSLWATVMITNKTGISRAGVARRSIAGCLLVAAGCLLVAAGCPLDAVGMLVEWLLVAAGGCCWDAACGRKILWMFSGYWWFEDKTILQAKKSLFLFGFWWFAAKIILPAKKSLNTFPEVMRKKLFRKDFISISWWDWSGKEVRLGEVG